MEALDPLAMKRTIATLAIAEVRSSVMRSYWLDLDIKRYTHIEILASSLLDWVDCLTRLNSLSQMNRSMTISKYDYKRPLLIRAPSLCVKRRRSRFDIVSSGTTKQTRSPTWTYRYPLDANRVVGFDVGFR